MPAHRVRVQQVEVPRKGGAWERKTFFFCCCLSQLKDCVLGKVYFNLVRIKIKHMEIAIVRRETTGAGR